MFCRKCGQQIKEGSQFCPRCGTSIMKTVQSEDSGGYQQKQHSNRKLAWQSSSQGGLIIRILILSIFILTAAGVTFIVGSRKSENMSAEMEKNKKILDNGKDETLLETEAKTEVLETSTSITIQEQPKVLSVQTYDTMYIVNCNESISLQSSPSISAAEIRQIPYGEAIHYIETSENGFYKVSYQGKIGYLPALYLSYQSVPTNTNICERMWVTNCNESITLRTSPSTSATEICQIPLGTEVSYIETASNGFYRIRYLGKTGYALAAYLSN